MELKRPTERFNSHYAGGSKKIELKNSSSSVEFLLLFKCIPSKVSSLLGLLLAPGPRKEYWDCSWGRNPVPTTPGRN